MGKVKKQTIQLVTGIDPGLTIGQEIHSWEEIRQVLPHYNAIKQAILAVSSDLSSKQIPIIMQPIWKTDKAMTGLDDNCLDVFVWSNLSIIQMALRESVSDNDISRNQRTIIWLYKMLWDFTQFGKFNYTDIVNSLSYKYKTDKAFAISGKLTNLFEQYAGAPIVENNLLREESASYGVLQQSKEYIDTSKNCLISFVKKDNFEQYINQSAKIYYTGKRFPSTVALNKLYYFMPYLKGKGIRDLYFIKIARIGTRKEGQPGEDKNDIRLVFEIEFAGQLFDDYKPVELKIWRAFTDTTMASVLALKESGNNE